MNEQTKYIDFLPFEKIIIKDNDGFYKLDWFSKFINNDDNPYYKTMLGRKVTTKPITYTLDKWNEYSKLNDKLIEFNNDIDEYKESKEYKEYKETLENSTNNIEITILLNEILDKLNEIISEIKKNNILTEPAIPYPNTDPFPKPPYVPYCYNGHSEEPIKNNNTNNHTIC